MIKQLKWNVAEKIFKSQIFFYQTIMIWEHAVCVCAYVVINEIMHPIILDWFE